MLLILALIMICGGSASALQVWDMAADWPATLANGTLPLPSRGFGPGGEWSYGYDGAAGGNVLAYSFVGWPSTAIVGFGALTRGVYTGFPGIEWVAVGKYDGLGWTGLDLAAGDVGGHTANWNDPIIFRWTAPRNMVVDIQAKCWVALVAQSGSSVTYGVRKGRLVGDAHVFDSPLFSRSVPWVQHGSANPNTAVASGVAVQAGDVLDYYAVGSVQTGFGFKIFESGDASHGIGWAKTIGPGWSGSLTGFVTAVFPDYGTFVMEAGDRSAAITVHPSAGIQNIHTGDEVTASGSIASDGTFSAGGVSFTGGFSLLASLGMPNKSITGAVGNHGLGNMDMLVTTWGKALDTKTVFPDGSTRFHISEQGATSNGQMVTVQTGPINADAVQVAIPASVAGSIPITPGNYVRVTGIAGRGQALNGDIRSVTVDDSSATTIVPQDDAIVEKGTFPAVVVALDGTGDFGVETPNSMTCGLQEAINYCVANGRDLCIKSTGPSSAYGIQETLRIPAAKGFRIFGGMASLIWSGPQTTTDDMIVIDSAKDCDYMLGSVICAEFAQGAGIRIRPKTSLPSGGGIGFTDSRVRIECITGRYPLQGGDRSGTGLLFDTTYGPITNNYFYPVALLNLMEQIHTPDTGYPFAYNHIGRSSIHTNAINSVMVHLGAASYQNQFLVTIGSEQEATGTTRGVDIYGSNNDLSVISRHGFAAGNEMIFEPSAQGNHITYLPISDNPTQFITDLATNPTNQIVWTGSLPPISTVTAAVGTYTYVQRLYPAVVRLLGGVVTGVTQRCGATSISREIPCGDILLSVGDSLEITSSSAPTIQVLPM